jgi:prophage antirepressor-like protein
MIIIKEFSTRTGSNIRGFVIDKEPWFVSLDIAHRFHYKDVSAMLENIKKKDKRVIGIDYLDVSAFRHHFNKSLSNISVINRSGLGDLILLREQEKVEKNKQELLNKAMKNGCLLSSGEIKSVLGMVPQSEDWACDLFRFSQYGKIGNEDSWLITHNLT